MSARITVLLVDDHAVVREGYRRLLEVSGGITVAGEATSAADAYQQFCILTPDVVVMDIALPGVSGIEALRRILVHEPKARVLMFSMYEDAIFVRRALEAGAAGYLTKAAAPRVLVEAVASVAAGRRFLSPDVAQTLALQPLKSERTNRDVLSAREFEVLKLLVEGCSLNDIAQQLGLNPKTVSNHQSAIRQKLGAETATQLLRAAMRLGLIPEL
ncbi:MAG TPA: response regulator transcription factor [Steroidobacter sp.]|uniref:response regulator transcription factor n=1 Tax=Steroidobacter sp. TaxID=1978227 RepID=UPI002EDA586F